MNITTFDDPLSDLLKSQKELVFEYPKAKIWNQKGISLARRLESDKTLGKKVDAAVSAENIKKYLVKVDSEAATRCIDGRIIENWDLDERLQSRPLGPKVAGGTAHDALAHRIVDVDRLRKDLLYEEDIMHVIRRYKHEHAGFGGHIDRGQHGSNTGCGAVDNIDLILDRLQLPEPQEQLRGLTKIIMGDAYDGPIINEVIGRMLHLDSLKPRYLPKEDDDPNGEYLYKKTIVDLIRSQASAQSEPVPALSGQHNEVAVVLNFAPNTTFDSDRFSHDSGNEIQAFGWDIWEMYEEARRLYAYDMYTNIALQRTAIENRIKYIATRTFLGIATTMVLTDGSLKVVVVKGK
jgi:hypothetical protein